MEKIRLFDLANLAIGTPEVGAANFTALHSLLHAILKQLQIQDVNVELPEGKYHPVTGMLVKIEDKGQEDRMELRIVKMEKQLEILNSLPSALDLIERSKSVQQEDSNTVGDMWQMMKISRRLELNEEGVCKAMTVMQDLLVEVNTLKESQHWVQDQTQKVAQSLGLGNLQDLHRAGVKAITENGIESIQKELESLKTRLKNLEDKLEALCDTLARHPETKDAWTYALGPSADDISLTFGAVNVTDISSSKGPVLYTSQTVSQPQSSSHAEVSASHKDTPHGTQDGVRASISQDPQTKTENSGRSDEINLTHREASIIQNTGIPFPMTSMNITASPGSLSSHVDIPHSIQDGMKANKLQDPQTKNSGQSDSINLTNQEAPVIQNTGIDLPMTSMDITASPGSLASHMDIPHATQDGITAPILKDPQTENSGQSEEIKSTHQEASMIQNTGIDLPMTSMEITASPGSLSSHMDIPHATQDGMTATTLQDPQIKTEISGQSDEISLTHPEASMPQNTGIDLPMPSIDPGAAPGSLGVSTAHQPGDISKELCTGVDALERNKADHIELKLLQTNTDDLATAVPDLQEKISCVNKEMQDLIGEKKAMDPVVTHTDQKLGDINQTNQHFGSLSTTIQNIEKELKELRDRQEREKSIMEQSLSQKSLQLQDQLDTLREILTTMASSSSTLLAMSIPKESGGSTPALDVAADTKMPDQGTTQTQAPVTTSASTEHLTCPACTIDIGQKVSKLVNQYEDLQELVTDYTSTDQSSKDVLERRKTADLCMQDKDVIGYLKSCMVQLQEECEHLNKTSKSLIQEHQNKQQHIDILYQAVRELEGKKSDTEKSGQQVEVIDRIEIDSLKKNMDERWKEINQKLQEQSPQYEAAGVRKQLITRFSCLSCDRSVHMTVSGQVIPTIPRLPCFPVHLSKRPHTVFAIGQIRQQSFRLKSRIHQARREASQLEMRIKHLHNMHSQLCQEIARVQLHFGGSDKASRKTIGHLLQAHCVTLGKISKRSSSSQRLGRLPELNSFGSESNSSSGGGRQTLISSQRSYTKAGTLHAQQKEDATVAVLKKEIIILGQKAPIYEGRRDSNLPPNKHKDGKRMSTTDNVLSRRFEENAYTAHRRPQLSSKLSY